MSSKPETPTAVSPPTYPIRTVRDFLTVPPERRGDCLHEFATWLACDDLLRSLVDEGDMVSFPEEFVWVDDGKRELEASFSAGGQKILVIAGQIVERVTND